MWTDDAKVSSKLCCCSYIISQFQSFLCFSTIVQWKLRFCMLKMIWYFVSHMSVKTFFLHDAFITKQTINENTPSQTYRKFHLQKLKIFR